MLLVLIALFAVAAIAPLVFRKLGRSTFYLLGAVPAAGFAWLVATFPRYVRADQAAPSGAPNAPPSEVWPWIGSLGIELAFRMDALSATLSLLVLGVGALVLFYCARYFKTEDPNLGTFGAQLLAFAGVMFGLATADDLILLFVFWELTTILSYLLIGFARTRVFARRSALQALMVTTFGGLVMLLGLVMLGHAAGTNRLSEIVATGPELAARGAFVDVAVLLVVVGAVSKSALVPFHFWLPGAMAAPTPVSAYLHAAAMVKAGVYLVARLAPGFSTTAHWDWAVVGLGTATLLVGGYRALRQHDVKLVLAYGTVSQLGFLMIVAGLGTFNAGVAALAMLLAHGLFKAALFLVVGIIDHQAGTRDVRELSGLWRAAPKLFAVSALATASMAGLPPLYGFVAKEAVLAALVEEAGTVAGAWVLAATVAGSALTAAYSARFLWGAFATKPGLGATRFRPVAWSFLAAPAVLSALSVAVAFALPPVEEAAAAYAGLLPAAGKPLHLALWHGLTPALGLSALAIAGGLVLFVLRGPVARLQDRVPAAVDSERAYRATLQGTDEVSVWLTGRTQSGSLVVYLAVILVVAAAAPASAALLLETPRPDAWVWFDAPGQLVVGLAMTAAALAAIRANKRFLAVLMVGVTGYGMAALFALQGAPDLALTQVLVETIVLVAMVLALRTLPARLWTRNPFGRRVARAAIAVGFSAAMVSIAAIAMASRTAEPISLRFPELAYFGGAGKNIVNVTLVDIRAWDTFGEITVLAAAATGVASLIFVRGRGDLRRHHLGRVESGSVDRGSERFVETGRGRAALAIARHFARSARDAWLVAGRTLAPERRSIIFEVVTRLLFHSLVLLSVYLLLAGHNAPGGGFSGGLLCGLALSIRYLAGGRFELAEATPVSPGTVLGLGLGTAAAAGALPLAFGGQVFQSAAIEFALPVFGEHKFVTSTVFDIGVYLVVVGLVLDVLRSLGSEIDVRAERTGGAPAAAAAASEPPGARDVERAGAPGRAAAAPHATGPAPAETEGRA